MTILAITLSLYQLPIPKNAHYAVILIIHHWKSKLGPPRFIFTDRVTEYLSAEIANCCTLFKIRHSSRTFFTPLTNGHVEVQNLKIVSRLTLFWHDTPENVSVQVHFYDYAHYTQTTSHLHVSPNDFFCKRNCLFHWYFNW